MIRAFLAAVALVAVVALARALPQPSPAAFIECTRVAPLHVCVEAAR